MFSVVKQAPPIEVFKLGQDFQADPHPQKVSLGVGAYRDDEGKPWVLPVVKKAEEMLSVKINDGEINHEYLPVLGIESFTKSATAMLLGPSGTTAVSEGRAFGVQALSGTGALRIGAEFLVRQLGFKTFYYSDPTWGNHGLVFRNAGFTDERKYRYWDQKTRGFNFEGMLADLNEAPENAVIILHVCAHNPTGVDPTREQWTKIADVMESRKLFPFFDCAYQGFASGDLDQDAWSVRHFVERGFQLFCAQSFSKNFGLYNERAGNLTIVVKNGDTSIIGPIKSQMSLIVRSMYSTPPAHGARIVDLVLNDALLFEEWKGCIKKMASRIIEMRASLKKTLVEDLKTEGCWDHITSQIGMFSYTGLNVDQCEFLVNERHLYLLRSGRISMCGLTPSNVQYVAQSIDMAVKKFTNN